MHILAACFTNMYVNSTSSLLLRQHGTSYHSLYCLLFLGRGLDWTDRQSNRNFRYSHNTSKLSDVTRNRSLMIPKCYFRYFRKIPEFDWFEKDSKDKADLIGIRWDFFKFSSAYADGVFWKSNDILHRSDADQLPLKTFYKSEFFCKERKYSVN